MTDPEKESYLFSKGWVKHFNNTDWKWTHPDWPNGFYILKAAYLLQEKVDRKGKGGV